MEADSGGAPTDTTSDSPQSWLDQLEDVHLALTRDHEPRAVLERLLHTALELTEARHGTLVVLNEQRTEFEWNLTSGIADDTDTVTIGPLCSRGVFGVPADGARALRARPATSGSPMYWFPSGLPAMHTFMGVPIMLDEQASGSLHLAEKRGEQLFTDHDERCAETLARWSAVAIESARLKRAAASEKH